MQLNGGTLSHDSGSQSSHSSEQPPAVHGYHHPSTHEIMSAEGSSEPPSLAKPKPHQCQICGRGFTTGGHLQRHQRIHTGVKAFKCPFPGCETRTSRQDNLQQHYRTHLSPSIRRGSGSAARAAVARAMEEAGIRPTASSRQRKAKSTTASSSSSSTHASAPPSMYGGASGHSTPSYGSGPYSAYEPLAPGASFPGYSLQHTPSVSGFATPSSASSSRVPSPANGHSAYFGGQTASYPQPAYSYSGQPANAYYAAATPLQPPFAQARMYAPTAAHPAVYSPINPSTFDNRSSSYPSLLPAAHAYPANYPSRQTPTSQHETSRQSSIEPQNAAQAYSYHSQRQHSASSLHSDYQRGAASTHSPPASRRITPPTPGAAVPSIDPSAAQVVPSPVTGPSYPSYIQQQQAAAAQRVFSDTYASQHSQSQRLYETDRFATAAPPLRKRLAYEEETSTSGDESQTRLHAYGAQPESRYQTASPIVSLTEKHGKEMAPEWAVERRVW